MPAVTRTNQRLSIRHQRTGGAVIAGLAALAYGISDFWAGIFRDEPVQRWFLAGLAVFLIVRGLVAWLDYEVYLFDRGSRTATLRAHSVVFSRTVVVPFHDLVVRVVMDTDEGKPRLQLTAPEEGNVHLPLRGRFTREEANRYDWLITQFVSGVGESLVNPSSRPGRTSG